LDIKKQILKRYYGFNSFREGQQEIIEAILNRRDTVAVMPTGSGKSLCFQIPALMLEGGTIVISPLISLMKDQVDSLNTMGIPASYINSSLDYREIGERIQQFINGSSKIMYLAPERLESLYYNKPFMSSAIAQIAVDEAHCVSEWGHDFRKSYKNISEFVKAIETRPVVSAFTATATRQVKEDIVKLLDLSGPAFYDMGLRRSNLYLEVVKGENKESFLKKYLKKRTRESGIIYFSTRKGVDRTYSLLKKKGYNVGRYHAGMEPVERKATQDRFINEEIDYILSTNAFGMGIDKPNIRFIIHYNMPKNIEAYYQEIGRAGRDGEPAEAYLLFSEADKHIHRFLLEKSISDESRTMLAGKKLQKMINFCHTNRCLWRYVSDYFDEDNNDDCDNCNNCLDKTKKEIDVTIETQKILSCVFRVRENFGASTVAAVLKGSKSKKLVQRNLDKVSTYGIMNEKTVKEIRELIDFLTAEGYLFVTHGKYPLLKLNESSWEVLRGKRQVYKKTVVFEEHKAHDSGLFEVLRKLRREIAREENVPPYVVFHDYTLEQMCEVLPEKSEELLDIKGVGDKKMMKYGERFINAIQNNLGVRSE